MNSYYQDMQPIIIELFSRLITYREVVLELNQRGFKTVSGKKFNSSTILGLRRKLGLNIIKSDPLSLKYYVYEITCNYPHKCNGFIYYGKHQNPHPFTNTYMGGGELLTFAQQKFGIEFFSKKIIAVFDSSEESEELEKELVNQDFIGRANNFNMSLGGRNSRRTQKAHPLKHRILEYIRDKDEANWRNQKVWEYRRDLHEGIKQIFLNGNIGIDLEEEKDLQY